MSETATAQERFEEWRRWKAPEAVASREKAQAERRERQRADATSAPLTLDGLLAKLEFSREYGEHLMQPYCACQHGHDGWEFCRHAIDLGWPGREWRL